MCKNVILSFISLLFFHPQNIHATDDEAPPNNATQSNHPPPLTSPELKEEVSMDVSPKLAIVFIFVMCLMLVSLFFFYKYLVYFIIFLFCIASFAALFACLEPLVLQLPGMQLKLPTIRNPIFHLLPRLGHIVLVFFCLAVVVTWVVERHEPWAWILQDILGVAFW